jgi:hypothetical protein
VPPASRRSRKRCARRPGLSWRLSRCPLWTASRRPTSRSSSVVAGVWVRRPPSVTRSATPASSCCSCPGVRASRAGSARGRRRPQGVLTDATSGRIRDAMRPQLAAGEYGPGLVTGVETVAALVAKDLACATRRSCREGRRVARVGTAHLPGPAAHLCLPCDHEGACRLVQRPRSSGSTAAGILGPGDRWRLGRGGGFGGGGFGVVGDSVAFGGGGGFSGGGAGGDF